jgi:hypothetical protein
MPVQALSKRRYSPFLPFVLLGVVTLIGGLANSIDAHGRVVDDTDDTPVPGIAVLYGSRVAIAGPDGSYFMSALPRGARLAAQKAGYSRSSAPAESQVLRLVPLTITFEVKDETTGKGIDTPEARQPATVRIGQGSASGEMVVGPYPPRDRTVLICAKGYESKDVTPHGVLMDVTLKPGGDGCPPLPSSAPPVQTVTPSSSPASAPPAPTPSSTP